MFDEFEVTGRVRTHVVQHDAPRFAAHPAAAAAFLRLRAAAARDGIELRPYSSFRGYDAQARIWDAKYSGRATLYDIDGRPRDRAGMSEDEVIWHILDWSALPGASRHQWGTEIDVVDGAVMPPATSRSCCRPRSPTAACSRRCIAGWTRTSTSTASSGPTRAGRAGCSRSPGT
jgi:LAS superfamily LD-carboxypeptidase LdcB